MNDIKLLQGDCLELMKTIPDNSIDLTVTSPPYDNLRSYNGNNALWGEHVWHGVIQELFRITKQGGVVAWIVSDATIKGSETGTSFKQALWAKDCGFSIETMIWEKTGNGCLGSNKLYAQNFEFMFVFSKQTIKTANLICDRENKVKRGVVKVNHSIDKDGKSLCRLIERKPFGKRTNIWRIDTKKNSNHPAPFPEKLAQDHIISWSNEGDTILDCFAGSGTTGLAALATKRNAILIEKEPEYCEIIKRRIADAQGLLTF